MAIAEEKDIQSFNLWRQGDERDPLGIWYGRHGVTGDGTGGAIKVGFNVPALNRGAHVHFCYDANVGQLTGVPDNANTRIRLLTNWPDASPDIVGLQGYGSNLIILTQADADFTAPIVGWGAGPVTPNQRFLPLWTVQGSGLTIVEMEFGGNTDAATYTFEVFGYYWDRAVMEAPGGPRHPGAS